MNTNSTSSSKLAVSEFLRQYGLTLETISARANCSTAEAYGALHPDLFELYPLILVAKVWSAVERELSIRGWGGEKEQLWAEFNARLKNSAIKLSTSRD